MAIHGTPPRGPLLFGLGAWLLLVVVLLIALVAGILFLAQA